MKLNTRIGIILSLVIAVAAVFVAVGALVFTYMEDGVQAFELPSIQGLHQPSIERELASRTKDCTDEHREAFVEDAKRINRAFEDKFFLALGTSRISLPPFVGDMQDLRRELEELETDACSALVQVYMADAFGGVINVFLNYLREIEPDNIFDVEWELRNATAFLDLYQINYESLVFMVDLYDAYEYDEGDEMPEHLVYIEDFKDIEDIEDKELCLQVKSHFLHYFDAIQESLQRYSTLDFEFLGLEMDELDVILAELEEEFDCENLDADKSDKQEHDVLVQEQATVAPSDFTPTRTPRPTYTPRPTNTPRPTTIPVPPTSTPTSTPVIIQQTEAVELEELPVGSAGKTRTAVVPAGWSTYKFIGSDASFAYPPDWVKTAEEMEAVEFERLGNQSLYISFIDEAYDREVRTETLKEALLDTKDEDWDITFHQEGKLDTPDSPTYVTALFDTDLGVVSVLATLVSHDDQIVLFLMMNFYVSTISSSDIDIVTGIARSVVFDWDSTTIVSESIAPTQPDRPHVQQLVNLRGGPGTNFAVVGSLGPADRLDIIARTAASDWYQITTAGGQTAWVAAFLVFGAPDIAGMPVVDGPSG